jgi:hypothetical protein
VLRDELAIRDIVYNHVGACGAKALKAFAPYLTAKYETPWDKAIDYDDERADPVRKSVCRSAAYWTGEFAFDGLGPYPIPWNDQPVSAELTLPPLAAIWLVPED